MGSAARSPSFHLLPSIKIAIIGAGPAGCTLARLLLRGELQVTVFEAEDSIEARSQGGTLDLHRETGLAALEEAGLLDEFYKFARLDGDAFQLCDKNMLRYIYLKSTKDGGWFSQRRPEIDREDLRRLLIESLPEGTIRWACRLISVDLTDHSLVFEHGVESGFDLVVGADGAYSRVRPLLSEVQPYFSGVGGFNMVIPDAERSHGDLDRLVNRGSIFFFSDGKLVLGQQMRDGSIYLSVWAVRNEDWMREAAYDVRDGRAVQEALCNEFRDWSPEVTKLIRAVDPDQVTPRSLFTLPVGTRWNNRPGLTLVGDAAHLMTPFAGEGVNAALKDAVELAHAIKEGWQRGGGAERWHAIRKYEESMFNNVRKVQSMAEDMMQLMMFTEGAPRTTIVRWVIRSQQDELNPIQVAGLMILVYTYYFFFRITHW